MLITELITDLTQTDRLPREAIAIASANRSAVVPAFLREIEKYLASKKPARRCRSALFLIVHLLGAWREKAAYRPIASLFRQPTDDLEFTLGDTTTATSHKIMAGVFDRDPRPLQAVISDPEADPFIRSRMCEALALVVLRGDVPTAEAARFFKSCLAELVPQDQSQVWYGWQNAIAMLGLDALRPLVEQAFDRGLIDPLVTSFERFDENLRLMQQNPKLNPPLDDEDFSPLDDVIAELSRWQQFSGTAH